MEGKSISDRLRQLDAYPKTLEDFRVKTYGGALVTVISGVLMVVLFASELNFYLSKEIQPELFVDTSRGQKLKINMEIAFPKIACAFLSIDAMDVSGEQQIDVDHNLFKQRLGPDGREVKDIPEKQSLGDASKDVVETVAKPLDKDRCESCYGAETDDHKCCNTCEEVREQYRKKGWAFKNADTIEQCKREGWSDKINKQKNEGCKVYGYLEVNKVAGNFHFAPGKSFQQHHVHVHDLQSFSGQKFNMSHSIGHLSFGSEYPGQVNPLDSVTFVPDQASKAISYQFSSFFKAGNSGKSLIDPRHIKPLAEEPSKYCLEPTNTSTEDPNSNSTNYGERVGFVNDISCRQLGCNLAGLTQLTGMAKFKSVLRNLP